MAEGMGPFSGSTEFLFVGSRVHSKSPSEGLFTSAGDAQELFCHMDAGYEPVQHVFGNVAYSVGVGGGILGSLKTLARGENQEFSDVFNHTLTRPSTAQLAKPARAEPIRSSAFERRSSAGPVRMR